MQIRIGSRIRHRLLHMLQTLSTIFLRAEEIRSKNKEMANMYKRIQVPVLVVREAAWLFNIQLQTLSERLSERALIIKPLCSESHTGVRC